MNAISTAPVGLRRKALRGPLSALVLAFVAVVVLALALTAFAGVVHADTQGPAQAEASNNIVLLVSALGVLIGVLIVARPRRGPKS